MSQKDVMRLKLKYARAEKDWTIADARALINEVYRLEQRVVDLRGELQSYRNRGDSE